MELSASMFGSLGQTVTQMLPTLYALLIEGPITLSLGRP